MCIRIMKYWLNKLLFCLEISNYFSKRRLRNVRKGFIIGPCCMISFRYFSFFWAFQISNCNSNTLPIEIINYSKFRNNENCLILESIRHISEFLILFKFYLIKLFWSGKRQSFIFKIWGAQIMRVKMVYFLL